MKTTPRHSGIYGQLCNAVKHTTHYTPHVQVATYRVWYFSQIPKKTSYPRIKKIINTQCTYNVCKCVNEENPTASNDEPATLQTQIHSNTETVIIKYTNRVPQQQNIQAKYVRSGYTWNEGLARESSVPAPRCSSYLQKMV